MDYNTNTDQGLQGAYWEGQQHFVDKYTLASDLEPYTFPRLLSPEMIGIHHPTWLCFLFSYLQSMIFKPLKQDPKMWAASLQIITLETYYQLGRPGQVSLSLLICINPCHSANLPCTVWPAFSVSFLRRELSLPGSFTSSLLPSQLLAIHLFIKPIRRHLWQRYSFQNDYPTTCGFSFGGNISYRTYG